MVGPMRFAILMLVLGAGSAAAAEPTELMTASDAVLCLSADRVDQAHAGHAAKSQDRLRNIGCLRSPAGVPATLLSGPEGAGIWSVRFRPEGMSAGITLWGRPSAFTRPDGTPPRRQRAEN